MVEPLDGWFKEMRRARGSAYLQTKDAEHVIYRGFKITKDEAGYHMYDVRHLDFYSEVTKSDMKILKSMGIIRGAAYLMYQRDGRRVIALNNEILNEQTSLDLVVGTDKTSVKKKSSLRTTINRLKDERNYLAGRQEQNNKEFKFEEL